MYKETIKMPKRVLTAQTLLLSLVMTLTGCSSAPTTPVLSFKQQQVNNVTTSLMSVKEITLSDKRKNKALSVINGVNSPADPKLDDKLQYWLNSSIQTNPNGRLSLEVNLLSYASFVNQETMKFTAESMMEWQIKLKGENRAGADYEWKKTYQTTINQDGPLKMGSSDIETHLNKMASKLLATTLNDPEFKKGLNQ